MDTVWLIISGSMMLVIGSIFWILPGPADRRRMKLRQLAFQQGFQVRAMRPEEIAEKFLITHSASSLYYYQAGNFPEFAQRFPSLQDLVAVPVEGSWQFYATDTPENILTDLWQERLPENLADSVSCLYFSKNEVGMLWNEKAGLSETVRILALLSAPFLRNEISVMSSREETNGE